MPGTLGGTSGTSNGSSGSAGPGVGPRLGVVGRARRRPAARHAPGAPPAARADRHARCGRGRRRGAPGRRSRCGELEGVEVVAVPRARAARRRRRARAPAGPRPCHTRSRARLSAMAAGQKSLNPAGPATTSTSSGLPRPQRGGLRLGDDRDAARPADRRGHAPDRRLEGARRTARPGGREPLHAARRRPDSTSVAQERVRVVRIGREPGVDALGGRARAPCGAATSMPPAPQCVLAWPLATSVTDAPGLREPGGGGEAGEPGPDDDDVSVRHRRPPPRRPAPAPSRRPASRGPARRRRCRWSSAAPGAGGPARSAACP